MDVRGIQSLKTSGRGGGVGSMSFKSQRYQSDRTGNKDAPSIKIDDLDNVHYGIVGLRWPIGFAHVIGGLV